MKNIVSKIINKKGKQLILIDDKEFSPLAFKSFRPTDRNISDFYSAGIRLFTILSSGMMSAIKGFPYSLFGESWIGKEEYDFSVIDSQIELFIKNAPQGYFAVMLELDTRDWWLEQNKEYSNSYWKLSQVEFDSAWRKYAGLYLERAVCHIEQKYGDRVFGYFLLCGTTTEWFSEGDYELPSPMKTDYYNSIKDDSVSLPTLSELDTPKNRVFLNVDDDKNVIEYRKFNHKLRADSILYFADIVKRVTHKQKLVGVYFGYIFELGIKRLINTGHIEYEKVFLSDNIDMIASPSSYDYRKIDSTSGMMVTFDTLKEHNKLYFLEFDHVTSVAPATNVPGSPDRFSCIQDTIDVMKRDFVLTITKGAALWWFDMFEGWFYDDKLMESISQMIDITNSLQNEDYFSPSQIALVVDPNSLYYCNKNNLIFQYPLSRQRKGFQLCGAPFDMFSMCDLDKIGKTYKLVVFLTPFEFSQDNQNIINALKCDNRVLLYLFAPNFMKGGRENINECCKCLNMIVKKTRFDNKIVGEDYSFELGEQKVGDYVLSVDDDSVVSLGNYSSTNDVAVAYKKCGDYVNAFCGLGDMPDILIRKFLDIACVHQFSKDNSLVVYGGEKLLGVYHRLNENGTLYLTDDGVYKDLFSNKIYKSVDKKLFLDFSPLSKTKLLKKLIDF